MSTFRIVFYGDFPSQEAADRAGKDIAFEETELSGEAFTFSSATEEEEHAKD